MQVSAKINNAGIKINVDLNVKKWLTKEYVRKHPSKKPRQESW